MSRSLTLNGVSLPRVMSFIAGSGMIAASFLTLDHFFKANFPESIFKGSFCDVSAFFNCDSSAYSSIAHFQGTPMGYFGLVVGILVVLGALFPARAFENTNRAIALLNGLGVIGLFTYTVFFLKSLCLLCSGYYAFSLFSLFLFWKYRSREHESFLAPSLKYLIIFAVFTYAGAYGFHLFYEAKSDAQLGGVAARIVKEYYSLEEVKNPSFISPYWTAKATDNFEDAPIRIIEYVDLLCPDCWYLFKQLDRLKEEYEGKINIAFQFFPLDAGCNDIVDKDLHPGACELSLMAIHDPAKFNVIHDEIFNNFQKARSPEWRTALAKKHGVDDALNDPETRELLQRMINTGAEYEKTSERYAHGIRSTPTMIINNRMVIGTLPYAHLKAIFESLLTESQRSKDKKFLENWVDLR